MEDSSIPAAASTDSPEHDPVDGASAATEGIANRIPWKRIALLLALCVGAVAIRLPFLSVPLTDDEGSYAYWASVWTRDYQIYRDFVYARPEGILVVSKILQATLGGSVEAMRLFAALFNCVTVLIVFFFARAFSSEKEAWVSAIVFAIFSNGARVEGFTANAEVFTLAPLVLNAYLCWRQKWFWAGVATAVAYWLKPSGVEGCLLIAIWVFVCWESWWKTIVNASVAFAGFAGTLLISVLHGLWLAGWDSYWYSMYTTRKMALPASVLAFSEQWSRIDGSLHATMPSWIVPAVLSAVAVKHLSNKKRLFCVAWLVAAWFGMQVGIWWNWHYFQQIIAPLSLASGVGLLALRSTSLRLAWATALGLALYLFFIRDAKVWVMPPDRISWEIYHRPEYLVNVEVARYVARTTAPDDTLYIAFGEAEIYYLSGRRPAVPTQMFYAHAKYFDTEWPKALSAIKNRVPAVIIVAQNPPPNRITPAAFGDLILEGYHLERDFSVISLYRRGPAPPE